MGVMAEIAEAFNDCVALNGNLSKEFSRKTKTAKS